MVRPMYLVSKECAHFVVVCNRVLSHSLRVECDYASEEWMQTYVRAEFIVCMSFKGELRPSVLSDVIAISMR